MAAPDDIFGVSDFAPLVQKGKALYMKARYLEAMECWKKAQAMDPSRRKEVEGYLAKASAKQIAIHLDNAKRFERGEEEDPAQALFQYRQILRLNPSDPKLRQLCQEKVRASETRSEVMSASVLALIAGAFAVLIAVSLWYIIVCMD